MLSSIYSLSNKNDIEYVKNHGKTIQNMGLVLLFVKRNDEEISKFAFIVSKNVSLLSVQRNRIRRAIMEAVRYSVTKMAKGYNMVFIAKKTLERLSTDEIMKETSSLLDTSNLVE